MRRDDDVWAVPGDVAPPPDPAGGYPRYPDEVVWLTDPIAHARAAALEAWLERRFPHGGTLEQRGARSRRRTRILIALSACAVVAVVAALVLTGLPDIAERRPLPWVLGVPLALAVLWAGYAATVFVLTRGRPVVSPPERDVAAGLTGPERRELRADLRSAGSPDDAVLDVVAAAWLARRGEVLQTPVHLVLLPSVWSAQWRIGWWSLVVLALAVLGLVQAVDDVRDLLAARDRVRRRGLPITGASTAVR